MAITSCFIDPSAASLKLSKALAADPVCGCVNDREAHRVAGPRGRLTALLPSAPLGDGIGQVAERRLAKVIWKLDAALTTDV
jgi:hypothetical protein